MVINTWYGQRTNPTISTWVLCYQSRKIHKKEYWVQKVLTKKKKKVSSSHQHTCMHTVCQSPLHFSLPLPQICFPSICLQQRENMGSWHHRGIYVIPFTASGPVFFFFPFSVYWLDRHTDSGDSHTCMHMCVHTCTLTLGRGADGGAEQLMQDQKWTQSRPHVVPLGIVCCVWVWYVILRGAFIVYYLFYTFQCTSSFQLHQTEYISLICNQPCFLSAWRLSAVKVQHSSLW